jgi:hypothetical protein
MRFYENAHILEAGEKTYAGQTDPMYWNAVGPFGGWIAAVFLRCLALETGGVGDPLTVSVNFAGPMEPGSFTVRLRELRANRSTTFWSAEMLQAKDGSEGLCAFATVVIARRRESPSFAETIAPEIAPPEELQRFKPPLQAQFLTRLDLRFVPDGYFPKRIDGAVVMWARALDSDAMDYETLAAICDSGMPQIFLRLKRPVPVSSVTMNVFFHATRTDLEPIGEEFVLTASSMRAAANGFFDETTLVWSRTGMLLATTEQIVWFKIPK